VSGEEVIPILFKEVGHTRSHFFHHGASDLLAQQRGCILQEFVILKHIESASPKNRDEHGLTLRTLSVPPLACTYFQKLSSCASPPIA
jgi:hypothetical protein